MGNLPHPPPTLLFVAAERASTILAWRGRSASGLYWTLFERARSMLLRLSELNPAGSRLRLRSRTDGAPLVQPRRDPRQTKGGMECTRATVSRLHLGSGRPQHQAGNGRCSKSMRNMCVFSVCDRLGALRRPAQPKQRPPSVAGRLDSALSAQLMGCTGRSSNTRVAF
jgi:hypothetical protein